MSLKRLNDFESQIVSALLNGTDPVLEGLRAQFTGALVSRREFSGVGVFTYFSLKSPVQTVEPENFVLDDVHLDVFGTDNGASAMLFVRHGVVDFLEVVAVTGDWPKEARLGRIWYLRRGAWTESHTTLEPSDTRDLEVPRMAWSEH